MRFLLSLIIIPILGCGAAPAHQTADSLDLLRGRTDLYSSLSPSGFVEEDRCDSLLFSALTAVGRGEQFAIEAAEVAPGKWLRLPPTDGDCGPNEISRDMLMGLLVYILEFRRLDLAESLWEYGVAHGWKMGEGDDRTVMTPSFPGILARIILHLGGPDHAERDIPDLSIYTPDADSWFGNHLQMLRILMDGKIAGRISALDLQFVRSAASDSPGNLLAQALLHEYTDGNQLAVIDSLLHLFPADRLPTDSDWCDNWRWQRKDGDSGLKACSGNTTHSGGDFLFVSRLLMEAGR